MLAHYSGSGRSLISYLSGGGLCGNPCVTIISQNNLSFEDCVHLLQSVGMY